MADIFLSYSRNDKVFVKDLNQYLIRYNKQTWIDLEQIKPATPDWWTEIKTGIMQANKFLIIVSSSSMTSDYCQLELDYARQLNKQIIVVIYEEFSDQDIFVYFASYRPNSIILSYLDGKKLRDIASDNIEQINNINWIKFEHFNQQATFKTIIDAINADLEHTKLHTRYLSKGKEWLEASNFSEKQSLLIWGKELKKAEAWLKTSKKHQQSSLLDIHHKFIKRSRYWSDIRHYINGLSMLLLFVTIIFSIVAFHYFTTENTIILEYANALSSIVRDMPEDAIRRLDNLREKYPDRETVYLMRGHFFTIQGENALALAEYDYGIQLNPNHPELYRQRGYMFIALEDYLNAIADFTKVIELKSDSGFAYLYRGIAYLNLYEAGETIDIGLIQSNLEQAILLGEIITEETHMKAERLGIILPR